MTTVICSHSHGWLWAVAVTVMAIPEASVTDNDQSFDRMCETLQNKVYNIQNSQDLTKIWPKILIHNILLSSHDKISWFLVHGNG